MFLYEPGMARRSQARPSWIDPSLLYSRQDIAERAGITDDVLSFWIKRGLLVPEPQEGSGKGVHHRFHFSQINVAIILKVLRDHFGANIGTLKSLADTLQSAIRVFRRAKAPPNVWGSAAGLADSLGRFRNGEPVLVRDDNGKTGKRKAASSEAEIIAAVLELRDPDDDPSEIIKLAEALGPGRHTDYEMAMVTLGLLLDPRYSSDNYWLLSNRDGQWVVRHDADDGTRDRSDVGPAMFLPIYTMVRHAWGIPSGLTRLDTVERLKAAFKDAGVEATVELGEEFHPSVTWVRDADLPVAQDIYHAFFTPKWRQERDGIDLSKYRDPSEYDGIYWTPEKAEG